MFLEYKVLRFIYPLWRSEMPHLIIMESMNDDSTS